MDNVIGPNFFYAKHEHRVLVILLRGFLLDLNPLNVEKVSVCLISKWLTEAVNGEGALSGEIESLLGLDQKFHLYAKKIVILKSQNQGNDAADELNELKMVVRQMIKLIDKIEQKYEM